MEGRSRDHLAEIRADVAREHRGHHVGIDVTEGRLRLMLDPGRPRANDALLEVDSLEDGEHVPSVGLGDFVIAQTQDVEPRPPP